MSDNRDGRHFAAPRERADDILPGVQMLRGLTALFVVITHANLIMGHDDMAGFVALPLRQAGMFSVAIFFAISGFIIASVSLDRDWRPKLGVGDYARRRFLRIVPFLWLSVIGYNLLSYAGTGSLDWPAFWHAMTLWPIGDLKPDVVWSLQHELLFYILFALAFLTQQTARWLLLLWCASPLLYRAWLDLYGGGQASGSPALAQLLEIILLGGWSGANLQFAAGLAIGLVRLRLNGSMAPAPGGMRLLVAIFLICIALIEWLALPERGIGRMLIWSPLSALVLWLAVAMRAPAGGGGALYRFGILLGNASFALYLVHSAVLMVLFALMKKIPALATLPTLSLITAFVMICVIAGIATHILVEAPLVSWLAHGRRVMFWQRRAGR